MLLIVPSDAGGELLAGPPIIDYLMTEEGSMDVIVRSDSDDRAWTKATEEFLYGSDGKVPLGSRFYLGK